MDATPETIARLRRILNERIPYDGQDTDTRFSDAEIESTLADCELIEDAAALLWEEKAAMVVEEPDRFAMGDESITLGSPSELSKHAMAMSERYRKLANEKRGGLGPSSLFARPTDPEIL